MVENKNGYYAALACEGDKNPLKLGDKIPVTAYDENGNDYVATGEVISITFRYEDGMEVWSAETAVTVDENTTQIVTVHAEDLLV